MKVLITGSNGLLGQKLIYQALDNSEIQLWATSKGENRALHKDGYTYLSLDISDRNQVLKVIELVKPDAIINTAAMTNVDACESDREGCWKLNVDAVSYLIEGINLFVPHSHLIHLSTDFIFDGTSGPYREEDIPLPLSYYAESKLEAEKIVQASGINWSILRTVLVYGVVDNMSRSNIVLWAKQALESGKKINVVNDQFRTPTLAEDLAKACFLTAQKKAKGIYHISGKDFMSVLELVNRVADFFNLDKSLITPSTSAGISQPAQRPPRTGFVIDKARKELGYEPCSFEEGLAIVAHQLK